MSVQILGEELCMKAILFKSMFKKQYQISTNHSIYYFHRLFLQRPTLLLRRQLLNDHSLLQAQHLIHLFVPKHFLKSYKRGHHSFFDLQKILRILSLNYLLDIPLQYVRPSMEVFHHVLVLQLPIYRYLNLGQRVYRFHPTHLSHQIATSCLRRLLRCGELTYRVLHHLSTTIRPI